MINVDETIRRIAVNSSLILLSSVTSLKRLIESCWNVAIKCSSLGYLGSNWCPMGYLRAPAEHGMFIAHEEHGISTAQLIRIKLSNFLALNYYYLHLGLRAFHLSNLCTSIKFSKTNASLGIKTSATSGLSTISVGIPSIMSK